MLFLLLTGMIVSGCVRDQTPEPDNATILSTFREHQLAVRDYSATVSVTSRGEKPEEFTINARYPDSIRIDYLESSARHHGTVSILNKSRYLEFDPFNNETILFETDPEGNAVTSLDFQGLVKKIVVGGNNTYAGTGIVEGREFSLIDLTLAGSQYFDEKYTSSRFSRARIWVDPSSWQAKRVALYAQDQNIPVVSADYRNMTVNAGIPDLLFDEDPYLRYSIVTPPTHPPFVYPDIPLTTVGK
jgi:outer membrane lipoprotein-sorting protein